MQLFLLDVPLIIISFHIVTLDNFWMQEKK